MSLNRQERIERLCKKIPSYSSGEMCSCYLLAISAGYCDVPCTEKQAHKALKKLMRDISYLTLINPNLVEVDCELEKTDTLNKLQIYDGFPLPEEKIVPYFVFNEPDTTTL